LSFSSRAISFSTSVILALSYATAVRSDSA